jgi:hypothetical protein
MSLAPKAKHFEPIEHLFFQMVKNMSILSNNLFLQNFKTLKFLYGLIFHYIHLRVKTHSKKPPTLFYIRITCLCPQNNFFVQMNF